MLLESRRSSHSEASSSSSPLATGAPEEVHRGQAAAGGANTGRLAMEATLEHAVEAGIDASMAALDAGTPARSNDH